MRKLPIAHEDSEATGVEIAHPCGADAVGDSDEADDVLGAAPAQALERPSHRERPVHVREFVGFDIAGRRADAREHPELARELLLEAEACAQAAAVAAHCGDVDGSHRVRGQFHCICQQAHAAAVVEGGEEEPARLPVELVTLLELGVNLKLVQAGLQVFAVRDVG